MYNKSSSQPLTPGRDNATGTPSKGTPLKRTPLPKERYATPAERASTPSKPKLDPTFLSTTDRFTLPGSVYNNAKTLTPGVGHYMASDQAARVRGAVKLQAAVRRRQSRGIFEQLPARQLSPSKVSGFVSSEGPVLRVPLFKAGERFAGLDSIYTAVQHPGVGEYEVSDIGKKPEREYASKAGVAFSSKQPRFDTHGGIYKEVPYEEAPPVEPSPEVAAVIAAARSARDTTTAAFRAGAYCDPASADRFANGSIYAQAPVDTPGVGEYATGVSEDVNLGVPSAAFRSTTDRFALPGSVYASTLSPSPGVGDYSPGKAARVRGAVKLQKAIRKRQSRGIFAQVEVEARQIPGPGAYDPKLVVVDARGIIDEYDRCVRAAERSLAKAAEAEGAEPAVVCERSMKKQSDVEDEVGDVSSKASVNQPTLELAADALTEVAVEVAAEVAAELAAEVAAETTARLSLSKTVSLDILLGGDDDDDDETATTHDLSVFCQVPCDFGGVLPSWEATSERLSSSRLSDAANGEWLYSQLERISEDGTVS